ncbi:hypothetical protein [Mycolicibacterium xanthum]|uniref:hypothetical protein n=1 Tax=Mycolicibacterium xanthum TaxID=2796469 RepID=UPI00355705CD
MMFFLGHGYRVIAHDRRGQGRSSLDCRRPRDGSPRRRSGRGGRAPGSARRVHVGHSTGGGEVVRRPVAVHPVLTRSGPPESAFGDPAPSWFDGRQLISRMHRSAQDGCYTLARCRRHCVPASSSEPPT